MKRLKRSHKNLMFLEAGYIWCKRRNIQYTHDDFEQIFMLESFQSEEGSEFDNICKDLRMFRYFENYQLQEITVEEYEMCVDEFEKL